MNLDPGTVFGEDGLLFDQENQFTIKSITPIKCLTISHQLFKKEFKKILGVFKMFC